MWRQLQYDLRGRWWGRWVLRGGLPTPDPPPRGLDELGYYRLLLSAAMGPRLRQGVTRVVDVGCRNWSYVGALADCFAAAQLVGIEADGLRRHLNLYRRIDYARAHAAAAGRDAKVLMGDFRRQELPAPVAAGGTTLFAFLFPFVDPVPCLAWGLPTTFVDYAGLLRRAAQLAPAAPAQVLAVHQGEDEAQQAAQIYAHLGISMRAKRVPASRWAGRWPATHDAWVCFGHLHRASPSVP